jgi:phenylalanyl-tRNA synthetase beta chain
MKFTLSWLRDHLETTATLEQISETLSAIGLEVESVSNAGAALEAFIAARIIEATQHPDADKLRVCKVDDGTGIRQVVCGAPNARAGITVALAREGVKIPASGITIKKSAIRGVESNGMLCSAHELGIGEDGGGIIELPASAILGQPIAAALGLHDPVIDIAVTPNRADCLGIYGIARDLAAAGLGTLKPVPHAKHSGTAPCPITVTLETAACPLFIGCQITSVKNGPSPQWLQQRLKAIGLRPISALVDITNFMTFAYARPLHVYDASKLTGGITVREAKGGETLNALNDKDYTLTSGMTAICDGSGVIGLGGVIGGTSTGCDEQTTSVFLEAALFDPVSIAQTGRALAIESDARHRFERGIDPAFVQQGIEIAIGMILELCGGTPSELVVAGAAPEWKRTVAFDVAKVATLGGLELSDAKIFETLEALGFRLHVDQWQPPSWRADIEGEADLVEEVLRIARYDSIPSAALPAPTQKAVPQPQQARTSAVRRALATCGLSDVCSFSFISAQHAATFGGSNPALTLLNPIHADLNTMRPCLLPGLIAAVGRNAARGFADIGLFELGNVFTDTTPSGQKPMASGLRSGNAAPRTPFKTERLVDAFDAKADLLALLAAAGMGAKLPVDRTVPAWYHPSRSGRVSLGGKITLGYFGELHPLVLAEFGIKHRVVAFEAFLDAIPLPKAKTKAKPPLALSQFQAVERDFAFLAGERVAAADILKAVEGADKTLIQSVQVFDVYSGKGMEAGKKSIAISVTLQAMDRTLSDQEIEACAQKIIATASTLGLALRG